ncbi:unnamed protein product [Rhizophagus irregularis]|nr:unnamed protein product [Rhizophagus irregularis]
MVKVTRKINQGATLRQATRLNISKKIQVRGLWKSSKIQNQGLSATLSAENLLTEFTRVYKELYNNNGIIIQRHINYYDSIQFIVRSKTDSYTNIILRVGEAIDEEDIDSLGERSYALIRAIITHK